MINVAFAIITAASAHMTIVVTIVAINTHPLPCCGSFSEASGKQTGALESLSPNTKDGSRWQPLPRRPDGDAELMIHMPLKQIRGSCQ